MLRRHDPHDPAAHQAAPARSSAALVALLLTRSDRSAQIEVGFAFDVVVRLPMLHAACPPGTSTNAAPARCASDRAPYLRPDQPSGHDPSRHPAPGPTTHCPHSDPNGEGS